MDGDSDKYDFQTSSEVEMHEIESGNISAMTNENFEELRKEIEAKHSSARMDVLLSFPVLIVGLILLFVEPSVGISVCLAGTLLWFFGSWWDSFRRKTVIFYDLEGDAFEAYSDLCERFDDLKNCSKKWHIESAGKINDLKNWKRNSGASMLVSRLPNDVSYELPSSISSNVTPPSMSVGKQVIFFMPDVLLVFEKSKVGAVPYEQLNASWASTRFIEDGVLPSDAKIVDYTWKHPNKKGGPDRRFKDNVELPICLYEDLLLQSSNGLNELTEFSRTGVVKNFVNALERLRNSVRNM